MFTVQAAHSRNKNFFDIFNFFSLLTVCSVSSEHQLCAACGKFNFMNTCAILLPMTPTKSICLGNTVGVVLWKRCDQRNFTDKSVAVIVREINRNGKRERNRQIAIKCLFYFI